MSPCPLRDSIVRPQRRFASGGIRILAGGRAAPHYMNTLAQVDALYADSIEKFGGKLDPLRRAPTLKTGS